MKALNIIGVVFAIALGLQSTPAHADSVVQTSTCANQPSFNCITGINNLRILGKDYDMKVRVGDFATLFPNPAPELLSWSNQTFADAALVAIYSSLISYPNLSTSTTKFFDVGVNTVGNGIHSQGILHIPLSYEYADSSPTGAFSSRCMLLGESSVQQGQCWFWSTQTASAFAVFSPAAAVPEPAAWLLVALGLFVLGCRIEFGGRTRG